MQPKKRPIRSTYLVRRGIPFLTATLVLTFANALIHAEIVEMVFEGAAGQGILAANEPGDTGNGSGGLLSPMTFDTDTRELFIDVGWGSGNGFTDLSSPVNLLNIHGPTADEAPNNYGQSAGGLISLPNVDPSPTSGGFSGTVIIPEENVGHLLTGRLYLHVHTDEFGGGEARGYFIRANAIPEPGALGVLSLFGLVALRRNRR